MLPEKVAHAHAVGGMLLRMVIAENLKATSRGTKM